MNTSSITIINKAKIEREKRERRARRVGMFFDTLTKTFAVLSAVILMWLLISWVDFCAHDLSRSYDFWLGESNLIYLICSCI